MYVETLPVKLSLLINAELSGGPSHEYGFGKCILVTGTR